MPPLPELEQNAYAKRAAVAWMIENPEKVLLLSLRKLIVYFGDDDTGAYWALQRGHGIEGPVYELTRCIANLHWLALLFLVYLSAIRGARPDPAAFLSLGLGATVAAVFFGHTIHHIEFEGFSDHAGAFERRCRQSSRNRQHHRYGRRRLSFLIFGKCCLKSAGPVCSSTRAVPTVPLPEVRRADRRIARLAPGRETHTA